MCIRDRGYEDTTVDQIAAAAGMSKRTFFRYFPSKDDLVIGKYDLFADRMAEALDARPEDEPVWQSLRRVFDITLDYVEDPHQRARNEAMEEIVRSTPQLHARYLEKMQRVQQLLIGRVATRLTGQDAPTSDPAPAAIVGAAFACMQAAHQAWSTSDKNGLLDRREFVFGQVRPGEKRAWTVPVKLPRSMDSRRDEVVLHFDEANDKAPPDVAAAVDVVEVPRPLFALSVQVDDRKGGNGDGLPARGESFTLRVDVRNAGPGAAGEKTFVSLKNLGDEKLFIKKGREVLGALKPGEARAAAMEVELKHGSKLETLPIRLQVFDEKTGEFTSQKLELQVAPAAERVAEEQGAVRVEAAEARVRGGAAAGAPVVASARKGAVLPTTGALPGWRRVEWAKGRFGFVAAAEVVAARGPRGGAVAEAWQREPPRITLSPDPGKGAPVVEAETFRLTGSAMVPASADPDARLRDVYVFVNEEKAFFKVVPEGTAPDARLDFTADLPLKPGLNLVTVFAREDEEFQGRRSFSIFRKPPAAVAETTPAARPATRTP